MTDEAILPLAPYTFAQDWADAWNARDVEAVLEHFQEDAVFSSPIAQRMGEGRDGVVIGKDAIRRYWTAALERNPELRFAIDSVHVGVDAMVIQFTTQDGSKRAEVLIFEGGRIKAGFGTFAVDKT